MRLFVALDLPPDLKHRLALLCGGIPGARWVASDNFHLTLRFIGEADRIQSEAIDLALAAIRAPGFHLSLAGIGVFAKAGKPTALWVGAERDKALDHLQSKIETSLQRIGIAAEKRRFSPHVTLARLDNVPQEKLASFVQANNLFRAAPVAIRHFTLFSSHLHKDGAIYTPEVEYELA